MISVLRWFVSWDLSADSPRRPITLLMFSMSEESESMSSVAVCACCARTCEVSESVESVSPTFSVEVLALPQADDSVAIIFSFSFVSSPHWTAKPLNVLPTAWRAVAIRPMSVMSSSVSANSSTLLKSPLAICSMCSSMNFRFVPTPVWLAILPPKTR